MAHDDNMQFLAAPMVSTYVVEPDDADKTMSVAVPESLVVAVERNPAAFGLAPGLSKRKALRILILRGAQAAQFEQREQAREAVYDQLHSDPEWRENLALSTAGALEDGLL